MLGGEALREAELTTTLHFVALVAHLMVVKGLHRIVVVV